MIRAIYTLGFCILLLFHAIGCVSVTPGVLEASMPRRTEEQSRGISWAEPTYRPKELKKLRVGMTKSEVLALFQEPRTIKRTPSDEYWEYDWFELYFRGGRLVNWFDL
ncbi:MAG: outer membrane protein assembly factor BamE [Spirochaetes bacterium]|nr:outer membrane protein assembly factor BamE [Spirochaetota bacterium]